MAKRMQAGRTATRVRHGVSQRFRRLLRESVFALD